MVELQVRCGLDCGLGGRRLLLGQGCNSEGLDERIDFTPATSRYVLLVLKVVLVGGLLALELVGSRGL